MVPLLCPFSFTRTVGQPKTILRHRDSSSGVRTVKLLWPLCVLTFLTGQSSLDPPAFTKPSEAYQFARQPLRSEEQRLNSSHVAISYAVFCLKKKSQTQHYFLL